MAIRNKLRIAISFLLMNKHFTSILDRYGNNNSKNICLFSTILLTSHIKHITN